jgi:hypothetical protein
MLDNPGNISYSLEASAVILLLTTFIKFYNCILYRGIRLGLDFKMGTTIS